LYAYGRAALVKVKEKPLNENRRTFRKITGLGRLGDCVRKG